MRFLVIGSGGREHALVWKLAQEVEVICTPGNPGIAQIAETAHIPASDFEGIARLVEDREVDLVVVGPEDPLIVGLGDYLRAKGILVYGPNADGARLEGSKAWSKELMVAAGVPTAAHGTFLDSNKARDFTRARFAEGRQVAVKASGAALGKGVVVAETEEQAIDAISMMMDEGGLGEAGKTVVIEDRLTGSEFSLLTMIAGEHIFSLPIAQDYKRVGDGDQGPNTGGMGTYSPVDWVKDEWVTLTEDQVVRPLLKELKSRGIDYRGTLFSGLMVDEGRISCLEYNVRFGDPETQSVMRRLGRGFAAAIHACALGEAIPAVEVLDNAAVTVVLASEGYPGSYPKGREISIGELPEDVVLFHAGTVLSEGRLVTNGGRVFGVSAIGPTIDQARKMAYEGILQVEFEGAFCRNDIADA